MQGGLLFARDTCDKARVRCEFSFTCVVSKRRNQKSQIWTTNVVRYLRTIMSFANIIL